MSETTNLKLFKHDNPSTNENQFDVQRALNDNWDKIDEHAGEVDNKIYALEEDNTTNKTNIEALQEDNTQNKQDIENLQESQASQDSDIEALMNALPSETQEGETANIKGTIPVKFKELVVGGNNKQESRSGKNKLLLRQVNTSINGLTIATVGNKITINGTATIRN